MSSQKVKIIGVLWVAALLLFFGASAAHGFGMFDTLDPTYNFADLLANPAQYASWNPDTPGGSVITLTYKFDASFTTDERIRDEVRLGLQQWADANVTPYGATYSYLRNTAWLDFYDIRSITVHELGHTLGFAHPFQVAPRGQNYDFNPTPPPTLIAVPDRGDECMDYGMMPGGYNLILSHDELNGMRYAYPNQVINYIEISSGTPDLLLRSEAIAMTLGAVAYAPSTGVQRNPTDPTQGMRITSSQIVFASDLDELPTPMPLGFRTLGQNWDVRNTSGQGTRGIEIQTRGTNNTKPVAVFKGDPDGFRFGSLSTVSTGDPDHKDDLLHTWSDPRFWTAAIDTIPAGSLHHIGLEQDVWDWTVVSARAVNADLTKTYIPLISFSQWNELVSGVDVTTASRGFLIPEPREIGARGIRVTNTEDSPCELQEIGVAVVDGRGLGLADLNRTTLDQLVDEGIFEEFDIVPRMLDYGEQLFLVLDGTPATVTNTVSLNRPDLLDHELFIYAQTKTLDAIVGSYALLGAPPIAMVPVPEPSTLVLGVLGLLVLVGCARRRKAPAAL